MSILPTLPWPEFHKYLLLPHTARHWEVYRKTPTARDSQRSRTHWATTRTQDGVNFQVHVSFQDPAHICQPTVSSASCLPSASFSLMPSNIRVCAREQWLCCQFKEPRLQRKGNSCLPPPPTPRFLLVICKSYSQEEKKEPSCVIPCSHHGGVNQGSLCSFLHHLFALPSLGDLAGKHSLFFIPTQRQWDFSYLHRNHASCDWKEHHGMQTERKAVKAPSCGF